MKRIYYLLAFVAVAAAFSACNPMDNTYKQLGSLPMPAGAAQTFNLTLSASDYGILPTGNYAKTSFNFITQADAKTYIPTILASKYPNYANASSVTVTYAVPNIVVAPADSVIADPGVSYTATTADYTAILGANPKFIELTTAQAITVLNTKYPTPVNNQIVLFTYIFFESGVVSTATTLTDTFLYTNGAWVKCYTISAAQFAYVGNTFGDFSSSDAPLINTYLATILKADAGLTLKAKVGDVKYVSYKYFGSKTNQRIQAMTFDGTNWVPYSLPQSLVFAKTNGVWVADNTVKYTLATADYTTISNLPNASANASAVTNLQQHGNFSISGSTAWADSEINAGIAVVLKSKYPTAVANQKFIVTYSAYNGNTISVTKTFIYNGTTFVYTP